MKSILISLALCIASSVTSLALPANEVPGTREGLALLKFSDEAEPVWYSLEEKWKLEETHVKFVDVTANWQDREERKAKVATTMAFARRVCSCYVYASQSQVTSTIARLSIPSMQSYLATLTAFNNRHYRSTTGAQASDSIFNTISGLAANRSDITVSQFTHSFTQKSVIAKFAGANPTAPITIFGAHLDSIAGGVNARAPGADDDGSGSVTLIESFRALIASGFQPSTPLQFHWYAGEEGGLLGSQDVAASYARASTSIQAMVQFDMTAYTPPNQPERIVFVTDRTNAALTSYLTTLVTTYNSIPAGTTQCGYGCSDHASWNTEGYPSAFPFESTLSADNPNIHSASDTINATGFSWTHMLEFTKLAVAAAIELTA